MADYYDLIKLEKKPKPAPPSVDTPSANIQSASLLANQQTTKPADQQASKEVNQQTDKEVKKFASLPANQQTSKLPNQQASKEVNQQVNKRLKKFGSYLHEESIKALKQIALITDRKDYEILQDAVDFYLKYQKSR